MVDEVTYIYFKNYANPKDEEESFDKEVFDLIRNVKDKFPKTIEGNMLANKFFGSLIIAFYSDEILEGFMKKQEGENKDLIPPNSFDDDSYTGDALMDR